MADTRANILPMGRGIYRDDFKHRQGSTHRGLDKGPGEMGK